MIFVKSVYRKRILWVYLKIVVGNLYHIETLVMVLNFRVVWITQLTIVIIAYFF